MVQTRSDEDLMLCYAEGDSVAFDTLYRRYKGPVFRYLLRQCGHANAHVVEELFQDIWMNVVKARQSYQPRALFKTYLFSIAHNRLIDYYRRCSTSVLSSYDGAGEDCAADAIDSGVKIDEHVHHEQLLERLVRLIDHLPEAQREAFLLQEEAGLSLEQIAAATDVKPETAKSRIRYAIAKLRRGLSS